MKGKWITCAKSVETPLFRKTFTAGDFTKAVIDISGLGYFTLLVNGRRVTDELFTPALTNYAERDLSRFAYPIHDTISCRVLYMSYDVTPFMRKGENTVEVIVGNGWYFRELAEVWFWRQSNRLIEAKQVWELGREAGVDGFCLSASSREVVVKSLELVMLGEPVLPTSLIDTLLTEQQYTESNLSLVAAQQELAQLIAQLRFESGTLLEGGRPTLQTLTTPPAGGGR